MSQKHQKECRFSGLPREPKGIMAHSECCCMGPKDEPTEEHVSSRATLEWALSEATHRANAASDKVAEALLVEEQADGVRDAAWAALREFDAAMTDRLRVETPPCAQKGCGRPLSEHEGPFCP